MASVALVEDDLHIQRVLTQLLEQRGHVVQTFGRPLEALRELAARPPDVVVLDLGLPGMDGMEVLRMLRAVHDVPIIVASARDADGDVVAALDRGADDYIVKPFSGAQLDARIRAVLRRTGSESAGPVVVGDLVVNPRTREVQLDGRSLDLNRKEFDILSYLAVRSGEVVSKRDLWRDVWHEPERRADKTIDVHLSWLRRKLGETSAEPRYLRTFRGVGVRLAPPGP